MLGAGGILCLLEPTWRLVSLEPPGTMGNGCCQGGVGTWVHGSPLGAWCHESCLGLLEWLGPQEQSVGTGAD